MLRNRYSGWSVTNWLGSCERIRQPGHRNNERTQGV
jgi:hypothetical protein